MLLDCKVSQMFVRILDIRKLVFGATDSQVKLIEDINLQLVKTCHKDPLPYIKLPDLIEMC